MGRTSDGGHVVYMPAAPGERQGHYVVRPPASLDPKRTPMHFPPSAKSPQQEARVRERVKAAVERRAAGKLDAGPGDAPTDDETVSQWFELWAQAREAKGLSTVADDRGRFRAHIEPEIGRCPISGVTTPDIERLVEALDAKVHSGRLAWKTARNVWSVVTRMFKDARKSKVLALRRRDDNPTVGVEPPDRGADRSKTFVFPSEIARFMADPAVPLLWRRMVVVATYLGVRSGELRVLEHEDIDLEHAQITVHRAMDADGDDTKTTKSGETREFGVEPNLIPLLRQMSKEAGGTGRLFPDMPRERDLAEDLRKWLKKAGVERARLYVSDRTRINLRFHDLRASHVTWSAVRGDSAERIMLRVGHEDWATMRKYLRRAEALSPSFGTPFPQLHGSLFEPEPSRDSATEFSHERRKLSESLRGGRDSNPRPPA